MTVGALLAASLEPLAHLQNVASLSFFYRYYFGRCSSELAQLVPLPLSWQRSTGYSDRLHDFSFAIPRCYKHVYVHSFFPHTATLWNSLPIKCFPLTYNLDGFKSRINRHPFTVGSFKRDFLHALILLHLFFCNSILCSGCSALHGVNPNSPLKDSFKWLYRKLAWMELESTTIEFCSDALTKWAIRPWVQLALRANFVQLLQFHRLFSVTLHFSYCLSVATFTLTKIFWR